MEFRNTVGSSEDLTQSGGEMESSGQASFDVTVLTGTSKQLSEQFLERILRFVAWEPNWDGEKASTIPVDVAKRAALIATTSLQFAPEPFVAPAPDGTLLLEWQLANGASAEFFVEEHGWGYVTLIKDHQIREVPIQEEADLYGFLHNEPFAIAVSA